MLMAAVVWNLKQWLLAIFLVLLSLMKTAGFANSLMEKDQAA